MRFTVRDMFWLTLLAAVVCVNWITYREAMNYKAERDAALKAWADAQTDEPRTTVHQSSTTIGP
jgi:hypothetical protein